MIRGIDAKRVSAVVRKAASGDIDNEVSRIFCRTLLVQDAVFCNFRREGMVLVVKDVFCIAFRLAHF